MKNANFVKQKSIIRKSLGYRKSPTLLGEEETLKVRVSEKETTLMGPESVYQKKRVDPLPFLPQLCEGDEVRNLSRSYYGGYSHFEPSYTYYSLAVYLSTHLAALYRSFLLHWESNLNQFPKLVPGFKIGSRQTIIKNYGVNG